MAIELSKTRAVASLAFSCLIAGSALGASPTVEDVLRFQPAQQDVQIDRPQGAEIAKCTLKPEKSAGKVGWVVRDSAGQIHLDMTQTVPLSNTAQTVGDALNAARAEAFGKWILAGNILTLFAPDGTTVIKTLTYDNAALPTQRTE